MKRVVIIGGGVIGASCAYYLARSGWAVTVADRGAFGMGCSHGNCGFVCPSHVLPLAEIQRRESGGAPLFEVTFNYTHFHLLRSVQEAGGTAGALEVLAARSRVDTDFAFTVDFSRAPLGPEGLDLVVQYDAARLDEAKEAAVIQVVEPAISPDKRFSPNRRVVVLLFTMLGFLGTCAYLYMRDLRQRHPAVAQSLGTLKAALLKR